ncbi:MAG: bifunctional nuclease family protein [Fibrobacteres bacterium]|jgi:bifunctional DNase/RNase|nr:bifunctional nuclease family protein [Fibrobacterota bacterium]
MSFDEWKFLLVEVEALTLSSEGFMVLLRPADSHKGLPIFIGAPEAHSIAQVLSDNPVARPLTHDLFKSVLEELGSEIVRALVTEKQEGTYLGRVVFTRNGEEVESDARPSDAIALALRFKAPIFVDLELWEQSSVPFERQGESAEEPNQDAVEQIRRRLADALENERYEEAARLRDELKRMQGGN